MVTFHEDNAVIEVEVLEDTSDAETERYKLRTIHVIQEPYHLIPIKNVFTVWQKKHAGVYGGMWRLEGYTKPQ